MQDITARISMKILSIDPGKHNVGWALFDEGELKDCGLLQGKDSKKITSNVKEYFTRFGKVDDIVVELPQVYQQHKWKGDPNDLIMVAFMAGFSTAWVDADVVTLVRPHDWKGSVPKSISNQRIMDRLRTKELNLFNEKRNGIARSVLHNMIDAIGIGFWRTGR